jgi:putative SOS response-associated peptidase YedK
MFKAFWLPASNYHPASTPRRQIKSLSLGSTGGDGERELAMARWGLVPFWKKEMPKVPHINVRAETVHKLPLFHEAFAKRRDRQDRS